jgi:L-fucose dehydrogenase
MNLELKNQVALVTGGAKGIGAGITRALAREGAHVCVLGRNPEEAEALMGELRGGGHSADAWMVELTDESRVAAVAREIVHKHGRIDIVVNNAGGNDAVGLRHSVGEFRQSLEKNIIQCFALVHHALDALIVSRGNIVNIGSKCATTGQILFVDGGYVHLDRACTQPASHLKSS